MTLDKVLRKNPNAAYRVFDGQATVVLPDRSEVNVLNEMGSLVWERIDGERTLEQILEAVLFEYDAEPGAAREDVLAFVNDLCEHEMVI